jgi:hypothetical protein
MQCVCSLLAANVCHCSESVGALTVDHFCTPKTVQEIAAIIEDAQGDKFLRELKLRWDNHNKSMHMIRDILMVSTNTACTLMGASDAGMLGMFYPMQAVAGWR